MNKLQELEKKYEDLGKEIEELKQPKFDYPLAFKSKIDNTIILFKGLKEGVVLKNGYKSYSYKKGSSSIDYIEHTNTDVWTPIAYDKEREFYDGQLVYCWDDNESHMLYVMLYDAINKCTFHYDGSRNGDTFDNYSATMPDFMEKAYNTLEGIRDD